MATPYRKRKFNRDLRKGKTEFESRLNLIRRLDLASQSDSHAPSVSVRSQSLKVQQRSPASPAGRDLDKDISIDFKFNFKTSISVQMEYTCANKVHF